MTTRRWLGSGVLALLAASLAEAQAPAVSAGGVVNAGNYSSAGVAPGSIVSIFGTNLASALAIAKTLPLPTSLGDVTSVTFNNVPAALFFVSAGQINAQLPWEALPAGAASGQVNVVVTRSTGSSAPVSVTVVAANPGIFTINQNGLGQAIATDNADGAIAAATGSIPGLKTPHAINTGDYLIIWCTGMGAVTPTIADGVPPPNGEIPKTVVQPTVLVGGQPTKFIYSVLSPQFVGVNQIGVQVLSSTPTGNAISVQIQVNGVTTSNQVTVAVATGSTTGEFFNYRNLSSTFAHFIPDSTTLPGIPSFTFSNASTRPEVGYQGGAFVNGIAIYPPWQVQPLQAGGTISGGTPMGVLLAYTPAKGSFGDNSNNQWVWYDMQSNPAYKGTCPSATPGRDGVYCPIGYNSGVAVGNHYYLVPDAVNQSPVFVEIDATDPSGLGSASAYSFWNANKSILSTVGWATGVYDGRQYLYYAPTVNNAMIARHDTTLDTNGISSNGWEGFDPSVSCSSANPAMLNAKGYLSSTWDGHRYIYFVPSLASYVVRYDTTGSFDSCTSYSIINLATLGQSGQPGYTGNGSVGKLWGFGGALIGLAGNTTNGQQYLYLLPWAYSHGSGSIELASTSARVQVGSYSNGAWNPTDITSTSTIWEGLDLSTLTTNQAWASNSLGSATFQKSGPLFGQSVLSGFQLGWINTHNAQQLVGFGANIAACWLLHNPAKTLNDPTGWTVVPVDPTMDTHNYGGPYDEVNQRLYPATPFAKELLQITGL